MMDTLKNIADIVSAFGFVVVAGMVAYIAYRQHRTDANKLRLDLYDRRLKVFEEGMAFIGHVVQHGDATDQALAAVNRAQLEGAFLFPQSVANYMSTLYDKGIALQGANRALREKDASGSSGYKNAVKEQSVLLKWFEQQSAELQDRLRPFMGFGSKGG